jgi:hypothetical protein
MSNPNEPQIKEIKCSNELLNHHHHPSKYRKENIKKLCFDSFKLVFVADT